MEEFMLSNHRAFPTIPASDLGRAKHRGEGLHFPAMEAGKPRIRPAHTGTGEGELHGGDGGPDGHFVPGQFSLQEHRDAEKAGITRREEDRAQRRVGGHSLHRLTHAPFHLHHLTGETGTFHQR